MDFEPTDEQHRIVDLFNNGDDVKVEARAGSGKTSTAMLAAESDLNRSGVFTAFNKSIVQDSAAKFGTNVDCRTFHSLAYREVGWRYSHRLSSNRMPGWELAKRIGVDPITITTDYGSKKLDAGMLASLAVGTVRKFCQFTNAVPELWQVPMTRSRDQSIIDAWDSVRPHVLAAAKQVWEDWQNPDGELPYEHGAYLKQWLLEDGKIDADFVLFDECQDADPVQIQIVKNSAKAGAQVVALGDSAQEIYSWRGATNALAAFGGVGSELTNSFRFGPEIAEVANICLDALDMTRVTGRGAAGVVAATDTPAAVLCRTNSKAVERAMLASEGGKKPHVLGGAKDVVSFARAAKQLQDGKNTYHPELACFASWEGVLSYAANDELGGDIGLLVKLVERHGPDAIVRALQTQASEARSDVVFSTAHAAKGREWASVQMASDFPDGELAAEEVRLLYVAATRAIDALDNGQVGWFRSPMIQA